MPSAAVSYRLDDLAFGRRTLERIARTFPHERVTADTHTTTYYDTFDWRVFNHGSRLATRFNGNTRILFWLRPDGSEIQRAPAPEKPGFAGDLPVGGLRAGLEPIVAMRRLLPLFTVDSTLESLHLTDRRHKTVARLQLVRATVHPARGECPSSPLPIMLRVVPVRGYDGDFDKLVQALAGAALTPSTEEEFSLGAAAAGLEPGAYTHRLNLQLQPALRADRALRVVLERLFTVMLQNEPGLRQNLDSEFLHDYRVAVRRTRSALTQLKHVLPADQVAHFKTEFSWLGQITGPTRDLDVYKLMMPDYRQSLPEEIRTDLEPLREFLDRHLEIEHRELVQLMDTQRYRSLIADWREFLGNLRDRDCDCPQSTTPILKLASRRIRRAWQRVLEKGGAIEADTAADALHRLRIDCKKLRYLLEFFRSLYPDELIDPLINALKRLQDNLGDYNDLEVQQERLRQFAQSMLVEKIGTAGTLMAMGQLVDRLEHRQAAERQRFHKRFPQFASRKNVSRFEKLCASGEMPTA